MPDKRTKPMKALRGLPTAAFSIVAIGASAGGLDACTKLIDSLPKLTGIAFILIQHLDPHHESMMAELLAGHTSMAVEQARDGMTLGPDHLYIIPPGCYLSVSKGTLRLSQPNARHGARLPFDFLLQSLAEDCPTRTIGVKSRSESKPGALNRDWFITTGVACANHSV